MSKVKISDKMSIGLKLSAAMIVAVLLTGCISAKSKPVAVQSLATPASVPAELTSWAVVAGNNLWGIASKQEVYNVPERWPLIYKANIDKIRDADLIYPGQVLVIPRNSSQADINGAVKHAKTRGPWAVGPIEATDTAYIRNSS